MNSRQAGAAHFTSRSALAAIGSTGSSMPQARGSQSAPGRSPFNAPARRAFAGLAARLGLLLLGAGIGHSQIPGHLDETFQPGLQPQDSLRAVLRQPDGRIIFAGRRTENTYDVDGNLQSTIYGLIGRLTSEGTLDTGFKSGGRASNPTDLVPLVTSALLQPDGAIVLGGHFAFIDSSAHLYLARLTSAGDLDASFSPSANKNVEALALQPDGRILAAGGFTNLNGAARSYVGRLNRDGSLDPAFTTADGGPNATVWAVALQADGRILIGGDFTKVDGVGRRGIARLAANGALDVSFDPGTGANGTVQAFLVQPDGKIVAGGGFTTFNDSPAGRLVRLDSNGAIDSAFQPGTGAVGTIYGLALQSNGKILLGGNVTSFDGRPAGRIARVRADGSLDVSFDTGSGADGQVRSMAPQPDGKILAGGGFSGFAGLPFNGLVRLYCDGTDAAVKPTIVVQPQNQTVPIGARLSLSVTATGTPPLTYLWRRNGLEIPGAIEPTLRFDAVQPGDAGDYTVTVSNSAGSTPSAPAKLGVIAPPQLFLHWLDHSLELTLVGTIGLNHTVEGSTNLNSSSGWLALTNFVLLTSPQRVLQTSPTSDSAKFYRALVVP